jgi:hypothetical protein
MHAVERHEAEGVSVALVGGVTSPVDFAPLLGVEPWEMRVAIDFGLDLGEVDAVCTR